MKLARRFASPVALLCLALAGTPCHAERADRNKPVHLESDQGRIDDAQQISTFEGKVLLIQGTLTIHSDKLVVVQNEDGFYHGTATGQPATFRQKREGIDEYVEGYADRIEYDAQTEIVEFFGHARMIKSRDEVRGDHITYNSTTEVFQVHGSPVQEGKEPGKGRVHVILQPKDKAAPPTPAPLPIKPSDSFTPQKETGHE